MMKCSYQKAFSTIGVSYPRMKLKHCFSFRTALNGAVEVVLYSDAQ